MRETVCVIGLGYIGLPTSMLLAKHGFKVVGIDVNPQIVNGLENGRIHIEEEGLSGIFAEVRQNESFRVLHEPCPADIFIIAVPTPISENRHSNLDYVISALRSITPVLKKGDLIILESTVPPGTTSDIVAPMLLRAGYDAGCDVFLAHCPERVLPGKIVTELVENNRIIGGYDERSSERAAALYRSFVKGEIITTTATNAEMVKLMENTYRDVNIALANELAKVSAKIGVNALEVIHLANKHPRVHLHSPGPGVGGHCIAVDPYFVIEKAPDFTPLMQTAREVNHSMPHFVVEQTAAITKFSGKNIAVFGITYKGNVDDTRESPALDVIQLLLQEGYCVKAHDPHVDPGRINPFPLFDASEALQDAHCLLLLADHKEFQEIDEAMILNRMHTAVIFDTKNIVKQNKFRHTKVYHFGNLFELIADNAKFPAHKEIAASQNKV